MKQLYFVFLVVIVACTGVNIFIFKTQSSNQNEVALFTNDDKEQLLLEKKAALVAYYDNGIEINKNIPFSTENESLTTGRFLKKYIKTTKLLFRYADINCNACVDSSLLKIKQLNTLVTDTNIIILASYNNLRDMYVWKRINHIKNPVLRIPDKALHLHAEQLNEPYFFIFKGNSAVVQNLFIPSKSFGKRTDEYLSIIATKLTKK